MAKYPAAFETLEGVVRLAGELDFTDPAQQPHFTPSSCYLSAAAVDIHAAATVTPKWNAVFDNVIDGNPLAAIPPELGITNPVNGSTARLTFSDAPGVWLYELTVNPPGGADATVQADLLAAFGFAQAQFGPVVAAVGADAWTLSGSFYAPADAVGGFGSFSIATQVAATTNPYNVTPFLVLTRIA